MPVEAEPEDSGDNDCGREAMAQILSCSIQEAVEIENGTLETISELQAIDIDKVSLAHTVQSKIKQQLQMFLARNSLSRVPPEDILSLQQICEEHLQAARIVKIKLGDIPGEEQHVGERIQQVMVLDCGLLSGYICLLIRSGGCQAVPWYARDIVQIVSDALTTVLETCVMPVHIPANRLQTFAATEPFAALISTCVQILQLLATLASDIQFSETVLNTLEATIFRLLLADNGAEKIGLNDLRTAALDLLVQAFRHYPAQRQSIINEILLSRKKMPASQGPRDSRLEQAEASNYFRS
ncbi:hypothetical protein B0O99DRAFT_694073 [Bisporella sp. PMI_857]|nr:hypothetical protein B0O99DRAFT_694073 [Bisporella sp. PMI_857]